MPITLTLRPGREKAIRQRHPWLFSGAIARQDGTDSPDGVAEIRDASGGLLARGFISSNSPLAARVWAFQNDPLDAASVASLIRDAIALRRMVVPPDTTGYRLVHAEGDRLPGLIVDRYGDLLAIQATTEGTERARPFWLPPLCEAFPGFSLVQKNGLPGREGEGLTTLDEWLAGEPRGRASFVERGLRFFADVAAGQKTGFFLDQRENRQLVREHASGLRVLNLFSYSGAFGVAALDGGATRVVHVDTSSAALDLARENHLANGHDPGRVETVVADVFEDLRRRVAAGEKWDLVVTDPPAFAKRKGDVDRACRGYKDINRLAMKLLSPKGLLLACSCSGPISAMLFQQVLFAASLDAGLPVQLLSRHGAGPDHPVLLDVPEGEYLKAFLLRRG